MKRFFQVGALFCGLLMTQLGFAQDAGNVVRQGANAATQPVQNQADFQGGSFQGGGYRGGWSGGAGGYDGGYAGGGFGGGCGAGGCAVPQDNCCPQDCPADKPLNDCWCLYVHYEPCHYKDWKCCEEPQYCTRRCCRKVPKYFEVQKCRYVPQYYCETCCRYENEYYDVQDCKMCKKWVCEDKCRYVPKYYYKHVCGNPDCTNPCPR
jgi:hypothetical protein